MSVGETFEVTGALTVDAGGELSITDTTLILPSDVMTLDGDVAVTGGSLTFPGAEALNLSGTGGFTLVDTGIESIGNLTLSNRLSLNNSSLSVPSQLDLTESGILEIIGSNVTSETQTIRGASAGIFRFVFDEAGISSHWNSVWAFFANSRLEVDAGAFEGGPGTYRLIHVGSSTNFLPFEEASITITGFDALGYDTSVAQYSDSDSYVELVLTNNDYGAWCDLHGVPTSERHISADADMDGVPNLIEYATGSSPALNTEKAVALERADGSPSFRFRRRKSSSLTYAVETSQDLVNWTEDGSLTMQSEESDVDYDQITVPLSSDNTARFIRLKVTQ